MLGCGREREGGETIPHPSDAPGQPRFYWSRPGVRVVGRMSADDAHVFALGPEHEVTALDKADGRVAWQAKLPLAAGATYGKSVLFAGGLVIAGDDDVFGLEPATGTVRWRFTPTVGRGPGRWLMSTRGDTVYTGSSSGDLFAIDATKGRELWRARLPDSLMTVAFVNVEDPIVDDDLLIARYTQRLERFPFFLGGVAAFRRATGAFVWGHALPQPFASKVVQVGAEGSALARGVVAVSSYAGFVYGYDRDTGALRWVAPPDSAVPPFEGRPNPDARPVASTGDYFVVGSGTGWVTAFDPATGRQRWRTNAGFGSTRLGLWTSNGVVFSTHLGGQTVAYDAVTGVVLWRLEDSRGPVSYGLLFDGDRVYGGDISGVAWAVGR